MESTITKGPGWAVGGTPAPRILSDGKPAVEKMYAFAAKEAPTYEELACRFCDGRVEMRLRGKVLCALTPGPEADALWECIESISKCGG